MLRRILIILTISLEMAIYGNAQITLPIPISDVSGLSADLAQINSSITQINNSLANLLSIVQVHGEIPAGTINGSNAKFTVQNLPSPSTSVALYKNGVRQHAGIDYSLSGSTITFMTGSIPVTGDSLLVDYQDPRPPYSRTLTINYRLVPNADETNFPVYVSVSDTTLKTTANGGHVQNSSGGDIAFYADAGLSQVLPFEMVSYDPAAGNLSAVINLPNVSHTANTVFYLGYGSPGALPLANPKAVWSGYSGVYHLEDNASNSRILNSAAGEGFASNGMSVNNTSGMSTTGQLGRALSFNGLTDTLDLGPFSVINGATALTYSGWVKFNALSQYALLIPKFDWTRNNGRATTVSGSSMTSDQDWLTAVRTTSATADTTNGFRIQTNKWYYFAYVYSAGAASLYINGSPVALKHYGPAEPISIPAITSDLKAGNGLSAVLDEIRVSTRTYSANWIATEYNNENNPSAFVTLGSEALSEFANPQ